MARLIPPHGTTPVAIVLTLEEALTALAEMNRLACYENREIRRVLEEYIDRLRQGHPGTTRTSPNGH